MSVVVKTPKGDVIDVNAVAEATPEDAFLLLSEGAQHEIETSLGPSTQQELGELIVLLADVVAKSAEAYPTMRIDVRSVGDDGLKSSVSVERGAEVVCRITCNSVIAATVRGVAGLWADMSSKETSPRAKYTTSLAFLLSLSELVSTISHALPALDLQDKPK